MEWGRPLAGLCSSAVRSGSAGQEGGGRQEGGRRGEEGPFLPTLDGFGLRHCERHTQLSGNIRLIRTVRCVGPPATRFSVRVRTAWGRGGGGLRVRSHCCSR